MSATAAVPVRDREAHVLTRFQAQLCPEVEHDTDTAFTAITPVAGPVAADAPLELDEAQRDKLLIDHLPQVQYIARRIHRHLPPAVLLEDLVHAGILGLIDAVRKYDPNKNVRLEHYAGFRIRGAILDSLRKLDWGPRTLRRQARRMNQAVLNCKARLGRDPTETEIAAELQIDLKDLQRLVRDLRGLDVVSLQSDSSDSGGEEAIQIPTAAELGPYHLTLRSEMAALLKKGMGELPERERQILALYHFQDMTLKETGAALGIGESRVSQILSAVLPRLRIRLQDMLDGKAASANGGVAPPNAMAPPGCRESSRPYRSKSKNHAAETQQPLRVSN